MEKKSAKEEEKGKFLFFNRYEFSVTPWRVGLGSQS